MVVLAPATSAPHERVGALDPFEVYADGFCHLRGIAVDDHGNVFVADRATGVVTRIAADRSRAVVARNLERPIGLAFDPQGRLLIAEEKAGRVVRVETNGTRTTLVAGIDQPRWLAVTEDGTLFLSARRLTRDTDPDPDDESVEPETILILKPSGTLAVFAEGFKNLQGLAANHATLFAATRGSRGDRRVDGVVYRIPILSDGSAGTRARVGPSDQYKKPVGLARDALGALYLTTRELDLVEDTSRRAVAKLDSTARLTLYAENLDEPQGVAFDTDGNLYVADGGSGRVLRFLAPPAPTLTVPAVTNQSPLRVTGMTRPGARVHAFVDDAALAAIGSADGGGAFSVSATLAPNASNSLEAFATSHDGRGLTSKPAEATVVHDSIAPALGFQAPPANAWIRGVVPVQVQATDGGTGIARLALAVDGQALGVTVTPVLPAPSATAAADWATTGVADGSRRLEATATDAAGNTISSTRAVLVDNTPPDTAITGGPSGTIGATTATFSFTGTDNLTPLGGLVFAWRFDGGPWAEFSPATTASFAPPALGPHTFEVKARDLAGNEDPTPARQTFTVNSTLQVRIISPVGGATVPAGSLLVEGTVTALESRIVDVGVTVNGVVAAVQNGIFAALVSATPGPLVLVAVGTTGGGASADDSVTVTITGAGTSLVAVPHSGLAPLTVSFRLTGGTGVTIALDADGDGAVDVTAPALDGQTFAFTRPGLYFPVATLGDGRGNQTTARTVVQVYDRAGLDAFFKAKWSAMKNALVASDLDGAAAHFVAPQQDRYRTLFTLLGVDIAQIARDMQDIELIYVIEGRAKYRLPRTQLWGGRLMTLTYYVYFVQDGDGLWAIESF